MSTLVLTLSAALRCSFKLTSFAPVGPPAMEYLLSLSGAASPTSNTLQFGHDSILQGPNAVRSQDYVYFIPFLTYNTTDPKLSPPMHRALQIAALDGLPFTTRRVALAAANGSLAHLKTLRSIVGRSTKTSVLPVVYTLLDPARIPTPADIDAFGEQSDIRDLGPVITGALLAWELFRQLGSDVDIPSAAGLDLWPRLWAWFQFLDTYRLSFDLPGLRARDDDKIQRVSELLSFTCICGQQAVDLSKRTPGFYAVVGRSWSFTLADADGPGLRVILAILTRSDFDPEMLEELSEGVGGSCGALASSVTRHIRHIVTEQPGDNRRLAVQLMDTPWKELQALVRWQSSAGSGSNLSSTCDNIKHLTSDQCDRMSKDLLKRCSACRSTDYCSEGCQRTDWKEGGHRESCSLDRRLSLKCGLTFWERLHMRAVLTADYVMHQSRILCQIARCLRAFPDAGYFLVFECTPTQVTTAAYSLTANDWGPHAAALGDGVPEWTDYVARAAHSDGRFTIHVLRRFGVGGEKYWVIPLRSTKPTIDTGLRRIAEDPTIGDDGLVDVVNALIATAKEDREFVESH
ncbi:hypothetical protein B0H16DRAFT_1477225 [Mycena metata]|uniref:MYND-type domain-containing protein n=1 Tax=Mycena metata TaxID=1033252 RepID=A0AAD7MFQ0_9AGAR|nr:hypothetical protein B0H16DRAFT_1477225 [Mycena metata]